MPAFEIYVFCELCVDVHRTGRSAVVEGIPPKIHRLTEIFAQGPYPADLAAFIDSGFQCPATQQWTVPVMPRHVFLAPVHP
jgi:hypothetical protein